MTAPSPSAPCPACLEFLMSRPALAEAAEKAGSHQGISGGVSLSMYLGAYHERGHLELAEPDDACEGAP